MYLEEYNMSKTPAFSNIRWLKRKLDSGWKMQILNEVISQEYPGHHALSSSEY